MSHSSSAHSLIRHLTEAISAEANKFKKSDYGTVYIKFIVNIKGQMSEVQATNMKRSRLAKVAIQAIENGDGILPSRMGEK